MIRLTFNSLTSDLYMFHLLYCSSLIMYQVMLHSYGVSVVFEVINK